MFNEKVGESYWHRLHALTDSTAGDHMDNMDLQVATASQRIWSARSYSMGMSRTTD